MQEPIRPISRHRRLRQLPGVRNLVRETQISTHDLIAPLFVVDGNSGGPIESMPGIRRLSLDEMTAEAASLLQLEVPAVAVFPVIDPALKDADGSYAIDPQNLTCRAVGKLKSELPDLTVIADVALDPYTTHGHDGVLDASGEHVDNDRTVDALAKLAVLLASAGCDIVAPSDMMDGRVAAIRSSLDAAGLNNTLILSYAAKFASSLYGPFREAVGSSRKQESKPIDKRGYQIEPANGRQAIADALQDVSEGADILMVKPAGWYLDVLTELRAACDLPLAAYQISGEYAQIHAAAANGWIELQAARDESLTAIKRAGADMILTYFAKEVAQSIAGC